MWVEAVLPQALLWYAWAQAFGFAGALVALGWLRGLKGSAYALGKPLGLLLGGFVYWLAVTLGMARNDVGAGLLALSSIWALGIWLWRRVPAQDRRVPLGVVLLTELLFALGLLGWSLVRAYSPEVFYVGGEKFMELMMINAILRSPTFPPQDAWMAGFSLSYYYFGYILLALLTRLSGIPAAVAFNLGHALIFALTMSAAFGLGYALAARARARLADPVGVATGTLAATMLVAMGNLGALLGLFKCASALPTSFWAWLDVREIATRSYACQDGIPAAFYGWWWDWSRVIRDYAPNGAPQEVITETPIFSFVLGDNHPHVMALPFVLLALGVAWSAAQGALRPTLRSASFILLAVLVGGLAFMNTWDFPVYGAILIAGFALGSLRRGEGVLRGLEVGLAAVGIGYMLYLPWHVTFDSQAQGLGVNLFNATRLPQFFAMFAPFLVLGVGFVLLSARQMGMPLRALGMHSAGLALAVLLGAGLGAVALGIASPELRGILVAMLDQGSALGVTREQATQALLARLSNPWTALVLALGVSACAALLARWAVSPSPPAPSPQGRGGGGSEDALPFALLVFGAGGLLTLAVEFVFVRDLFGTRMNTVFKFYYQAWTLWSVAGAVALVALLRDRALFSRILGGLSVLLVAAGVLWLPMAMLSRSEFFANLPTLDGMAYIRRDDPDDAQLIEWLNANAPNGARVAEAATLGAYRYEGRIATFTGLPTILGWGGHQHQWRGSLAEPARREPLVVQLYSTTDERAARTILTEFGVRYVVVGRTERATFPLEGLDKFDRLCRIAFESRAAAIFDCS